MWRMIRYRLRQVASKAGYSCTGLLESPVGSWAAAEFRESIGTENNTCFCDGIHQVALWSVLFTFSMDVPKKKNGIELPTILMWKTNLQINRAFLWILARHANICVHRRHLGDIINLYFIHLLSTHIISYCVTLLLFFRDVLWYHPTEMEGLQFEALSSLGKCFLSWK